MNITINITALATDLANNAIVNGEPLDGAIYKPSGEYTDEAKHLFHLYCDEFIAIIKRNQFPSR